MPMASRGWKKNAFAWRIAPPADQAESLARQLHLHPLAAQVLCNRGLIDIDAARAFLHPTLTALHDPAALPGCQAAARRALQAIRDNEKIVIYGDYDVDGMTATAILHACLTQLGATVESYVPHRLSEGYGLNADALKRLIDQGAKLIITVDCGISAAATLAEVAGTVDVIITDHHTPPETLPDVVAVVHPRIGAGYANPDLCGAGVALKLAWEIARQDNDGPRVAEGMKSFLLDATSLAAMGTIADVVPLVGENRVLTTFGLRGLTGSHMVGIRALLHSVQLTEETLETFHVGFVLAPRLNAAGRMGHASEAIELLTTTDPTRAANIASELATRNTKRQSVERVITEEAIQCVEEKGFDNDETHALVLAGVNWHVGVIGIVASRLVDRYHKPTIVLAIDNEGIAQGSGRSVPGFDLAAALQTCSEHLVSHGGHAMAAGLRLRRENIEAFTAAFDHCAETAIEPEDRVATLDIDAETSARALTYPTVSHLEKLAPFGQGNRRPLFAMRNCTLVGAARRMGARGQTLGMTIAQDGATIRCVGFRMGDLADALAGVRNVSIAGRPALNTYRGKTNVQLEIVDVQWD
jgi:single-stranded-DNA-specific exonuclease